MFKRLFSGGIGSRAGGEEGGRNMKGQNALVNQSIMAEQQAKVVVEYLSLFEMRLSYHGYFDVIFDETDRGLRI